MDISRDQDSFLPISRQGSILTLCHGGWFGISVQKYIGSGWFQLTGGLLEKSWRSTVEWFSTLGYIACDIVSLVARCVTVPRRAFSNASRSDSNVNPRFSTPSYWELKLLERVFIWAKNEVERYVIAIYIARFKTKFLFIQLFYRLRWYFIFVF